LDLSSWTWRKGSKIIGTGDITSFTLPVRTHEIVLTVVDTGGYAATDSANQISAETPLMNFGQVTTGEFGPDGKLYVGTVKGVTKGTVGKITLNADYTAV
jgi:hypothetical protein